VVDRTRRKRLSCTRKLEKWGRCQRWKTWQPCTPLAKAFPETRKRHSTCYQSFPNSALSSCVGFHAFPEKCNYRTTIVSCCNTIGTRDRHFTAPHVKELGKAKLPSHSAWQSANACEAQTHYCKTRSCPDLGPRPHQQFQSRITMLWALRRAGWVVVVARTLFDFGHGMSVDAAVDRTQPRPLHPPDSIPSYCWKTAIQWLAAW
jgi:hypothetical protein